MNGELSFSARLQMIRTMIVELTQGDTGQRDDLHQQIDAKISVLADDLAQRDALTAEADRQGNELIQMMLAMAVGDYSVRVAVGDDDTLLNALGTGLNMLSEEVAAYRDTRERLQQEIIQMQAATLREVSTPIIPITDEVLVMPLIGTIDAQRAQQVIEALLEGIAARQADVAILDITGVAVVDTLVANGLIRAAKAAQLLGARVVLTGMRPEVAQTLVGLDVDLSSIATYGSLQAGIGAVLQQFTNDTRHTNGTRLSLAHYIEQLPRSA